MSDVIACQAITYKKAYDLISEFHYLGNKRFIGQFCFGIFENQILVGAVVYSPLSVPESAMSAFGLPRGHYADLVEMSRMVLSPRHNGANYGSQLIGYSLRQLKQAKIRAVITYADSSRHYGAIYQACNFGYYGLTAAKKDFYLNDGQKLSRGKTKGLEGTWKPRSRKHRYLYIFDKSLPIRWQKEPYPKNA